MRRFAVAIALFAVILIGIVLVGCHTPPFYASGIGGNLKPVRQNDDGTWLLVPVGESDALPRDGQRRGIPSLPSTDAPSEPK